MNATVERTPGEIERLRARLAGTLARPGEPGYESSACWNTAVQLRPAAVVLAHDAQDVIKTMRFAGAHGYRVGVHCTGHGAVAVDAAKLLLIHTGSLDELVIDPTTRRARVGAGVCWQRVINEAAEFGLTPVAGSAVGVGVAGYLSGGGIGPLVRTFGVSSDWVTALDAVTGEGELMHATPDQNRDLFWGLRGGKATLGVIRAVEIELVEARHLYGGALYFDGADADLVLRAWSAWTRTLPGHANTSIALLRLPALPGVPAPLAGRLTVAVRFTSTKPAAVCEPLLTELRSTATPLIDAITTIPVTAISGVHADPVHPSPVYSASRLLRELPDAAIDGLLTLAGPGTACALSILELRLLGGAFAHPGTHPSAFCHRDAAFNFAAFGSLSDCDDHASGHQADQLVAALAPWTTGATMANFAASGDPDVIRQSYDSATLLRLSALADWYDPAGVLRVGQVVRDV
jgi:hypothetical protein